jgi:hypothetical protein
MNGACSMHGKDEMDAEFWSGNLTGRYQSEDLEMRE